VKKHGIAIIGAPMDLGAGRRGVDMGPSAVRLAGLNEKVAALGYEVEDLGNIGVVQPESVPHGPRKARYLSEITRTCETLAAMVEKTADAGKFPLVLGGDHSIAVGTVSGLSRHYQKQGEKIGLIWIDAHADMNTPDTSPSGNIHGMPLACCIGLGPKELSEIYGYTPKVAPENVAIVGLRSVDQDERRNVQRTGVRAYTMRDVDERGLRAVMQEAIEVATNGTAGFHLSFDMDSVDPHEAPGVGTPVKGGFTYREAHLAMEIVCDCDALLGLEMVEVNPVIDEANRTAVFSVELVMSSLGKRIL
jgi:arginase